MKNEDSSRIGQTGRWIIFLGVAFALGAMLWYAKKPLENLVGQRAFPYVVYGLVMVICVWHMLLYNRCPRRLVIPLGIIGWISTFALQWWFVLKH